MYTCRSKLIYFYPLKHHIKIHYNAVIFKRFQSSNQPMHIDAIYRNVTSKKLTDYEILGISPKSTHEEIKGAFISLAKIYHPDICKDPRSRTIFMKIKESHDRLQKINFNDKIGDFGENNNQDIIFPDGVDLDIGSLETELERLDRYKRYVQNDRNDIVIDKLYFLKYIIGVAATFGLIIYACVTLPKLVEFEAMKSGKPDIITTSDTEAEEIVEAFYNPVSGQWERIIYPFKAPTPSQLVEFYTKNKSSCTKKLNKIQMPHRTAILKTTYLATSHPAVLYDPFRQKLVQVSKDT